VRTRQHGNAAVFGGGTDVAAVSGQKIGCARVRDRQNDKPEVGGVDILRGIRGAYQNRSAVALKIVARRKRNERTKRTVANFGVTVIPFALQSRGQVAVCQRQNRFVNRDFLFAERQIRRSQF